MSQLGKIFDSLEKEIIDLWENEVMLGLGLHVKYTDLADDLCQTCTGYSFLDDPSNPFKALEHALGKEIWKEAIILSLPRRKV